MVAELLAGIDLRRAHHLPCWLNRVAIELLYVGVASFERNRHLLVPRLLDGPMLIERWTGHRLELALTIKFMGRFLLSREAITNLIHIEITKATHTANLLKTVAIPP